ncbi:MAG: transposase, partial [Myxococcales bacterium]|nr:transposase [Myxococcales bacterium]
MPYSAQQRVRARRRSAGNLGSLERKRTDDTVDSVRVAGRGEVKVLDETPAAKAIGYARNQRIALQRFLSDGRLPIHNNGSENALRREA